jgi:hypothetical protein
MAFVVEDGTGRSDANSYCSVADADTYHATYTLSAQWAAAAPAAKENALVLATQYLDARYGGRWLGYRAHGYGEDSSHEQALDWPRIGAYDADGWPHDEDVLPVRLVQATCEVALRVLLGDDLLGTVTAPGGLRSESVTVGPVSESRSYVGSKPYGYLYPKIEALVRPLICAGGQVMRG